MRPLRPTKSKPGHAPLAVYRAMHAVSNRSLPRRPWWGGGPQETECVHPPRPRGSYNTHIAPSDARRDTAALTEAAARRGPASSTSTSAMTAVRRVASTRPA
ncbi:uncharacterized protein TRAVEDRAFT_74547 [Trametes versicolor FP-101664 SS1]|uniref:uncharacterized protein n=1 Tax=Trametes versicolor (strain FP-101664) TaxID=717944 RepID=UPI000462192E|nr:uncharacterized protein TRAVEDRAFT_74547 [Trametes versicolor FP-101664 SS1]EIW54519.1 hypothetical protein TRAVEDRAFT_74547 [Trametes versicolor FP-101664 SS1]